MALTLYFHPLSSFCHKALIALYETDTPFTPHLVDLGNAASRAEFLKIWPMGKFPVLRDEMRNWTVPELSIIIEYLAQHYPGTAALLPRDADLARQTRMRDRFYDLHIHVPMQKVITDRLRPAGMNDTFGVEQAKAQILAALDMIEPDLTGRGWTMGDTFTMADCAAAPALFYANMAVPFAATHPNVTAYLDRLMKRPSYARVLKEAEPYFKMIPR